MSVTERRTGRYARPVRERDVERYLGRGVEAEGGLCLKWVSPGMTGVPDRLVIHGGRVYLVELKSPTGRLSERQKLVFPRIEALGVDVAVVTTTEEADQWIAENLSV